MVDYETEINSLRENIGLVRKLECTKEENKKYKQLLKEGGTLPEGIFSYKGIDGSENELFYTIEQPEISEKELYEYIMLKQYKTLRSIRACLIFFVVLTVTALILAVLFANT